VGKVLVDLTISPLGTATPSISDYVAACERVLSKYPHIKRQLNPMSTTLEGDLADILTIIQEMHEVPFAAGALRVSTSIRIDDRRDKEGSMQHKVAIVKEKAGLP
jgi:uncharacterized protein (TIGR00106 family)